jgi:hypothetical protein
MSGKDGTHLDSLDVPMQPTPPPPIDLTMIHEQVTWLTRELETLRRDSDWMRAELQQAHTDIQQARTEAQQACNEMLQARNDTAGRDEIRAADPPYFTGSHRELEGWITACRLGIASQPSKFNSEYKKIIWAASFLDGPPRSWVQPLINTYLVENSQPPPELISFDTLADALRALYGDPNLERNAIANLYNIRQTSSVAEYRSRFISHSQHTKMDSAALAPYFYRGLKGEIKDLLAGQEEWNTFEELQQRASRIDARLQARRIEKEREMRFRPQGPGSNNPPQGTNMDPLNLRPAFASKPAFVPAARATPPNRPRTPPTTPAPATARGGPTPMELDSQRRMPTEEHDRCMRSGLCFTCKEFGHLSKECPRKRVRIAGLEMELEHQAQQAENDDAQE